MSIAGMKRRSFSGGRLTARRLSIVLVLLVILLAAAFVVSITIGSERVGVLDTVRVVTSKITGQVANVPLEKQIIITDIRLPRVLMAIVVGAALAVAGSAYQALLRNPLADPGILGIS